MGRLLSSNTSDDHNLCKFLAGESGDEYIEREDYPMCQQVVYDSEEYSYSEGEQISSGDEFDREEELRGYNRAIDFTLHTIIEESCEDSEPENRSLKAINKKRHSDPSELEKYFFYGVGGGNVDQEHSVQEESEYSDNSDPGRDTEHLQAMRETCVDGTELTSSRLEKYFMSGFSGQEESGPAHSLDAISEAGQDTDDSGGVGSESDGTGQKTSDGRRKKTVGRPRGFRSERLSDRTGESGAENVMEGESHDVSYSSESSEDNTAFVSGDGSTDTIKRKKNKARKQSDERRSDSERAVDGRRGSELPSFRQTADHSDTLTAGGRLESLNKKDDKSSPRPSPSITPLPNSEMQPSPGQESSSSAKAKPGISPSGSDEPESMKPRGPSKDSPSTSPPPAYGPVRKHKSRDSGFVGSNDDLLRNEGSHVIISSSDTDMQSKNHTESSSEGEHELVRNKVKTRLEKVSEVSENTEDDCEKSMDGKFNLSSSRSSAGQSIELGGQARKKSNGSDVSSGGTLSRKDSFHQWSSDEETNIMMNRMRAFFKNMLVNASKGRPLEPTRKPTQILQFEQQLTRLMKTVPGINDQQVKEIVEYLSSEDAWSDSCDSSDYTDYTSSDLECLTEDPVIPDMDVEISASVHQDMIEKIGGKKSPGSGVTGDHGGESEEFQKETEIMYQKLMTSFAKMQQSQQEEAKVKANEAKKSPPIASKILHHISTRLVTLMHEVSASDNSSTASMSDSRQNLYLSSRDFRNNQSLATSSPRTSERRRSGKLTSLKSGGSGDNENENSGYTFNSLDSPKVLMGPNLGTSPQSNPFKLTKNTSKSVEVLDIGRRRASLDDKTKSTSSDYDVWQGIYRDGESRRGSLPRGHLDLNPNSASTGGVSEQFDDERFSWKGSFESALAADPRTRLSIEAKRRSIGSDCNSEIFSSVEQMDRSGSKSSLVQSRSPSISSKRSLKSSLPNSRSSLHVSKSEKELTGRTGGGDSDSDEQSVSSSVRSSVSSRYGRRSSVPEASQVLARLSEDDPSPPPTPVTTSIQIISSRQHSTNSLPRLGTSAIQKSKTTSTILNSSPSQPSNIQTSTQGESSPS